MREEARLAERGHGGGGLHGRPASARTVDVPRSLCDTTLRQGGAAVAAHVDGVAAAKKRKGAAAMKRATKAGGRDSRGGAWDGIEASTRR